MVEDDLKKLKHKNIDLVRENVKLRKERQELLQYNVELREQVYRLTLYMHKALEVLDKLDEIVNDKDDGRYTAAFNKDYDGMPGYNPEILEVRYGTND